ncbi:Vacuolar protein sorting-associated protein 52 B [Fulvia fulva]|uniref:Vacuolar protein sorting-associated protein 52 B n=1 Tax=Passalora fulva TaxID=5499 RepID=A0A9Q8P600_PASFU|nr:Vacuolar protein sorting-associated protein 52 B [Fulvia fulva]KAK4632039.1 Vacuolar protein sorting-associated protein 52 B [Fulvia fulva]KAK4633030.1 Vacuolar protein sorting-associated protein 52 B [Fulvia fulva]UJO14297.1 Vacuolar protein sorting-associated protein 52 B [Fulvia fulva]WPV10724.1 Vacuolar protein sorting-associated protein 52 B [Fulvia fulva]WPV26123.1 Vacuolar protein sorting-associated protein 52 B [Fulvia fulva]
MSMWLDRFSVQSREPTPSPTPTSTRSFSPAPRRSTPLGPSTLQRRPGLQPRSSSLSLASVAGSTDSLPATARVPNGSNLKNQLSQQTAPADGPDPLTVLQGIIGPTRKPENDDLALEGLDTTALAQQIDFGHLSLQDFASQDAEWAEKGSDEENVKVIQDFEQEKDKFEDLHKSIVACDEVLKSVETYLTSFQAELAAVSTEIESLQSRSTALNNKLENRKAVEKILGPEAEAFSIPPHVVRKITEGAVDEQWIKSLQELEKRSRSIDAKLREGRDIKAAQDVQPFINDISNKAVERIRDYVVAQIKALRSPSINAQVIQQNSFLRYKDVFSFLVKHQPGLAEEISQAYSNTMRWYYLHNFTRYKAAVEKLNVHVIDQTDVLAAEGGVRRLGKSGPPHDTFSIGRRADVIRSTNDTALPSFAAEEDKGTHYIEVPFRAYNLALLDNASGEYSFLTEFFSKQSFHATNRKFNEIFQPTFELGYALTKQLIEHTLDALGILICVRLTQHFAFELQRRKIPVGEGYINGTNMLLWPRFQQIIDAHCDSIRKLTASLSGKPAGSALSLTSSPSTAQTTAPHPLTQRFANFLQGILALSSEAGDDEPVSNSLSRLRGDFQAFLIKLSKGTAEARKRERFLYNNYSLICTIIGETEGKLADEQRSHFADLRDDLGIEP